MGVTRWIRTSALVAGSALLMVTAGCSDDSSGDGDDADASSESSALESPDAYDCLLSSSQMAGITGFTFSGVEPDGGSIEASEGSLTWEGCKYDTDGDATVELATIVDENGEPDAASYDAFAADARESDDTAPGGDTEIGEGSFFDADGGLYVRTAESTLHFSLSAPDAGDPRPEDLEAIAIGVLEARGSEEDCENLPGQLPIGYSSEGTVSTGTTRDGTIDLITCRFAVVIDGQDLVSWDLEVAYSADPEVFDQLVAQTDRSGSVDKVEINDIGDSAVQHRTALYFKSGDTAYAVEGEDDAGQPLAIEVLEEIAQAVIDSIDPDSTESTEATSEPTEPTEETTAAGRPVSDDFCTNVQAMLDALDDLFGTFEADDYPAYVAWAQSFVPLGQVVIETAPADQADDALTAVTPILDLAREVAALEPTDKKAIDRAFNQAFSASQPGVDEAGERILASCGIDPDSVG